MRFWAAWVVLFLGVSGCAGNPDERAIRDLLEKVRTSMERLDYDSALQPVAPDYTDNAGNDLSRLKPRFGQLFGRFQRLEIRVDVRKLVIEGLTARMETRLKVDGWDGGQKERLFGNPFQAAGLQIQWEKRAGVWKIVGGNVMREHWHSR